MVYPDTVVVVDKSGIVRVYGDPERQVAILDFRREAGVVINQGDLARLDALPKEAREKLDSMKDGFDEFKQ